MSEKNVVKKEQNTAFRCLYGFGVLFILLSHCDGGGVEFLNNWINFGAFHVSVFLFGSGFFFKKESLDDPKAWFVKKLKTLILPLYIWNTIYSAIILLLKRTGFFSQVNITLKHLILSPLVSSELSVFNLAAWFIFPFFAVQVIWYVLAWVIYNVTKGDSPRLSHLSIIFILIGIAGVYVRNLSILSDAFAPLFRIAYFCPFYGVGRLFAGLWNDKYMKYIKYAFIPAIVISFCLNGYFGRSVYAIPSSCDYPFGVIATYLSAFCGIVFWLSISTEIPADAILCKPLTFLADNGFSIMMHQFAGFFLLNSVFAFYNHRYGLFNGFDISSYKNDIWYMFLPGGINESKSVYVLAGISISVLISLVTGLLKRHVIKLFMGFSIIQKKGNDDHG